MAITNKRILDLPNRYTLNDDDFVAVDGNQGGTAKFALAEVVDKVTSDNAELTNIRTGADGTTYQNAGDAVRGQISDLKESVDGQISDLKEDLVDSLNLSFTEKQIYPNDGIWSARKNYATVYAPVVSGKRYTVSRGIITSRFSIAFTEEPPANGVAYFDAQTNNTASELSATAPENAKYICAYVFNAMADADMLDRRSEIIESVSINAVFAKDLVAREEIAETNNRVDSITEIVNLPFAEKQIYPKDGAWVVGKNYATVYAPVVSGKRYTVSRGIITSRFSIAFTEEPPANGVAYFDAQTNNTASELSATAPENAKYICAYVFNAMADADMLDRRDEIIASVSIDADSAIDLVARSMGDDKNDVVSIHKNSKHKAEVLKIQRISSEKYSNAALSMIFFTDVHNDIKRVSRFVDLVNAWGDSYINVAINGGDTTSTIFNEAQLAAYDAEIARCAIPVLNTIGNHDAYSTLDGSRPLVEQTAMYDAITAKVAANVPNIVQPASAAENGLNYYYYDKGDIRIIMLDCMYWNEAELTWFEEVLGDAITNSKDVIAVSHYNFISTEVEYVDSIWNPKSYDVGGSASYPMHISAAQAVKVFEDNGGKFIIWLCGHSHGDSIKKLKEEYGKQFQLICPSFVNRASTVFKSDNENAYNYDCLTYLVVDTNYKIIRGIRIGANINNEGSEYHGFAINYETGEFLASY